MRIKLAFSTILTVNGWVTLTFPSKSEHQRLLCYIVSTCTLFCQGMTFGTFSVTVWVGMTLCPGISNGIFFLSWREYHHSFMLRWVLEFFLSSSEYRHITVWVSLSFSCQWISTGTLSCQRVSTGIFFCQGVSTDTFLLSRCEYQ